MLSRFVPQRTRAMCLCVGLVMLAACGSDSATTTDTTPVSLLNISVIKSGEDVMATLTSEIYSQALEAQGYRVTRRAPATDFEAAMGRLENGEADLTFGYSTELYAYLQTDSADPKTFIDGATLNDETNAIGEVVPDNLLIGGTALAQRNGFIACTKEVADANTASTLTQLAAVSDTLTLAAPAEFSEAGEFRLERFTKVYGAGFKEVTTATESEIGAKLSAAEVDCGAYSSVDGLVPEGMVALTDDRAFITRDAIVPVLAATDDPGVQGIVDSVSQALTTDVLITLMGATVTAKQSPVVVAGTFLTASGIAQKAAD